MAEMGGIQWLADVKTIEQVIANGVSTAIRDATRHKKRGGPGSVNEPFRLFIVGQNIFLDTIQFIEPNFQISSFDFSRA